MCWLFLHALLSWLDLSSSQTLSARIAFLCRIGCAFGQLGQVEGHHWGRTIYIWRLSAYFLAGLGLLFRSRSYLVWGSWKCLISDSVIMSQQVFLRLFPVANRIDSWWHMWFLMCGLVVIHRRRRCPSCSGSTHFFLWQCTLWRNRRLRRLLLLWVAILMLHYFPCWVKFENNQFN